MASFVNYWFQKYVSNIMATESNIRKHDDI